MQKRQGQPEVRNYVTRPGIKEKFPRNVKKIIKKFLKNF